MAQVVHEAGAWNDQLLEPDDQKSWSHEAEDRFGVVAEASFSTALGRVAFIVNSFYVISSHCAFITVSYSCRFFSDFIIL